MGWWDAAGAEPVSALRQAMALGPGWQVCRFARGEAGGEGQIPATITDAAGRDVGGAMIGIAHDEPLWARLLSLAGQG